MKDHLLYERYQRQVLLKELGIAGQQKLLRSKVVVVGAGGLGCPVLQYLAAAGVGEIGIVDDDVIALNNLHRQPLYTTNDIGLSKAETAASVLKRLNPTISVVVYPVRLTNQNALNILRGYDIIIDGTDNFAARYMINDASVILQKPFVYGAISRFEGQVAVFNYQTGNESASVNYRDIFPQPPAAGTIPDCAEAGVLGVLPGIIGSMQANETIKLVTGIGEPLINQLFTYNALSNQVFTLSLLPRADTRQYIPANENEFLNMDYEWYCSVPAKNDLEIDPDTFEQLRSTPDVTIIDVRDYGEQPTITEFKHLHIPLGELQQHISSLNKDIIIAYCQTGKRSLTAAKILSDTFGKSKQVFSLQKGIINWKKNQQETGLYVR